MRLFLCVLALSITTTLTASCQNRPELPGSARWIHADTLAVCGTLRIQDGQASFLPGGGGPLMNSRPSWRKLVTPKVSPLSVIPL